MELTDDSLIANIWVSLGSNLKGRVLKSRNIRSELGDKARR